MFPKETPQLHHLLTIGPLKPKSDQTKLTVVKVKDLKANHRYWNWLWGIFCPHLKKKQNYTCATGRPEPQAAPFPLGWTSNSAKMKYIITLFQKKKGQLAGTMSLVWPCHYCFLWSKILGGKNHPGWLDLHPKTLTTPVPLRVGGGIRVPGKCIRVQWGRSFGELGSQPTLTVSQAHVWPYCGGLLLETLLVKWSGTCTLIQWAIPFTLAFQWPKSSLTIST
jgi:hypothetical protein